MKFESKFAAVTGPESYDNVVKSLLQDLKDKCDLSKVVIYDKATRNGFKGDDAINKLFDMVQDEFDTSDNLKLYPIYHNYHDTNIFIGIFKGYGPTHAKVRAAIEEESTYYLNLDPRPITEEYITKKISDVEKSLDKWRNII